MTQHKDRDLHTQIEDLLMALSDLQRQHADLSRDLQLEREEREEEQELAKSLLNQVKANSPSDDSSELVAKAEERFGSTDEASKRESADQTKDQLHDDLKRYKEMHQVESSRSLGLTRRLDEQEQESASLREEVREARGRIQDGYRDRQRLERMVRELRSIKTPASEPPKTPPDQTAISPTSDNSKDSSTPKNGLRELKLVRSNSQKTTRSPSSYNKRSSHIGLKTALSNETNTPAPTPTTASAAGEESLLLELVNAKTAEAVAKQELEEFKVKFESLRKMISGSQQQQQQQQQPRTSGESRNSSLSLSPASAGITKTSTDPVNSGGFWSGWGRRAVSGSTTANEAVEAK